MCNLSQNVLARDDRARTKNSNCNCVNYWKARGIQPYMGHVGMSCSKWYVSTILAINKVSVFTILVINSLQLDGIVIAKGYRTLADFLSAV